MTDTRTILSVVGPHSGAGKTSFVTRLLRHVPGLGCLKISPAHEWPDAVAVDMEAAGEGFYLEDLVHHAHPDKDSALYVEAGAVAVKRLRHRGEGLAAGLDAALRCYAAALPVVVESSSAVKFLNPVAVVLVFRPPLREMKPSTAAILSRVTDLLVNASDDGGFATAAAERLRHECPELRPQYTWSADLISEALPAPMLTRLRALLDR